MFSNLQLDGATYLADLIDQHASLWTQIDTVGDCDVADLLLRDLRMVEHAIIGFQASSAEAMLLQAKWIITQVDDALSPSLRALADKLLNREIRVGVPTV